jgi:hypothetical protein
MSFSVTITADNEKDLFRQLATLLHGNSQMATKDTAVTQVVAPIDKLIAKGNEITAAGTKKSKPDAPDTQAASESTPAATKVDAGTSETAAAIDYKTVGDAINAAVKLNKQAVVDLLGEFKAKRGTELKPEQYAYFLAKVKAIEAVA